MPVKTSAPRLFVKNRGYNTNTVLNWHREPEKEFALQAEAYWRAAKALLRNEALDKAPGAFFDACPIIKLYRDSLELFLKAILLGPGADLVNPSPSRKQVIEANHGLTKLLPDAHRIFALCGWEDAFGGKTVATFDDFEAIVNELEKVDPHSAAFRYPIKKDLTGSVADHFTFSVRGFASTMDEVLATLSSACDALPDIAHDLSEANFQARCDAMEHGEHPEYEFE